MKKTKTKKTPAKRKTAMMFDQGSIPTISMAWKGTEPCESYCDAKFSHLVSALREFLSKHFSPVWGVKAHLKIAKEVLPGTWGFVFMDDADVAGALGYHDLTSDGLPLSKIFLRVSGKTTSVTASHELAEVLVDPAIQLCAEFGNGVFYAYETADAVEETEFLVQGIPMTNFVYPAWFEGFHGPKATRFDHLGLIQQPFELLEGGYMPVWKDGAWTQIFGSKYAEKKFDVAEHGRVRRRLALSK